MTAATVAKKVITPWCRWRKSITWEAAYRNIQNYTHWVEYDTTVVLKVEQAVPHIMDALS